MAHFPHIGRTIACVVAASLFLALPATGQTTRPAGDPLPTIPEVRQQLDDIAAGIRGAWATRDEVIEATQELERARRDFRAEYRRIVMRLRQDNPEYLHLQERITDQRQKLQRLRQERLEHPPRRVEDPERRSDGNIVGRVGGTGRTSGRIMGENNDPRQAGLTRREREELETIVREREPLTPSTPAADPRQVKAAQKLLAIQAELDELEAAAIRKDALATEMQNKLADAAAQMQTLEQDLADQLQNDPDFKAARQALADARERAASR